MARSLNHLSLSYHGG